MLYIVATPIGNLDDLSYRQAKILSESDVILAEDTRSAQTLLSAIPKRFKFHIPRSLRIISYYKEREFEKLPEVFKLLKDNKNVSLVSESGLPLISDPGQLLVEQIIKQQLPFTVIPGPSAATAALVYSGFKTDCFMFLGFLPKKYAALVKTVEAMRQSNNILKELVFIFYESPQRINQTLKVLDEKIPKADVCICREMTKQFEETIRGKPKDLMNKKYKGEVTLVIKI